MSVIVNLVITRNPLDLLSEEGLTQWWDGLSDASKEKERNPDFSGRTALHHLCSFPPTWNSDISIGWLVRNRAVIPMDLNQQDAKGNTPLLLALQIKNCGAVHTLLQAGANPNIISQGENGASRTPLFMAFLSLSRYANAYDAYNIRLLLEWGANPYITGLPSNAIFPPPFMDSDFSVGAQAGVFSCFLELFPKSSVMRRVLECPPDQLAELLTVTNNYLENLEAPPETDLAKHMANVNVLYLCMLACANSGEFERVKIFARHVQTIIDNNIRGHQIREVRDYSGWASSAWKVEWDKEMTLMHPAQQMAIVSDFEAIQQLFMKTDTCVRLLQELDQAVSEYQSHLNFDFSQVTNGIATPLELSVSFPSSPGRSFSLIKTHGLLFHFLSQTLAKQEITSQEKITLLNFDPNVAELLEKVQLFQECRFSGTGITHGIYSHYLQWYIICKAIEKNIITLENKISNLIRWTQMMKIDGMSCWQFLFDTGDLSPKNLKFTNPYVGDPIKLNSILLCGTEHPHLSGLMRLMWFKDIERIQKHYANCYQTAIPYEALVAGAALAYNQFYGFRQARGGMGYVLPYILSYYNQKHASSQNVRIEGIRVFKRKNSFWDHPST